MVNKDEYLREFANIASIIENMETLNVKPKITFNVSKEEYDELFIFFQKKYSKMIKKPKKEFSIMVGDCEVIFNMNNV